MTRPVKVPDRETGVAYEGRTRNLRIHNPLPTCAEAAIPDPNLDPIVWTGTNPR